MAFNVPDIDSIMSKKNDAISKINDIQEVGLPGVKDLATTIWKQIVARFLLSPRQIIKKLIMLSSDKFNTGWFPGNGPMTERDAQIMVYGKEYYRNGKLYDKDYETTAWVYYDGSNYDDSNIPCVSHPGDEDYHPPLSKDNPFWQDLMKMVDRFKKAIKQLAIKLGEFLVALPQIIITIAVSLISLVSSIIILPFGAGIPTALTAVNTVLKAIKDLQAKVSELLPPIEDLMDAIGIILPKSAQPIINLIMGIFSILVGIIGALGAIIGIFGKIQDALSKLTKKSEEQEMKVKTKADPSVVDDGEETTLNAEVTGGSWDYDYEWSGPSGVVGREQSVTLEPEFPPQKGLLKPRVTYTCKATDRESGDTQESKVTVKKA